MDEETKIAPGFTQSLWKFFVSVKLTVVVLLALAILSVIGTLVPQNLKPFEYRQVFDPFVYRLFVALDIFDMYHSWWFQGLILLLVVNIVICSIDRLQTNWKVIFVGTPQFNLESFRKRKSRRTFEVRGDAEALKSVYERRLAKSYGYCHIVPLAQGFAITAEKGRWTRLGVYGVHLSIVVLLIGSLVGANYGFEGYANIPEGQSTDTIELRFTGQSMRLPFAIRCDDFDVQFYGDSQRPKEFRSSLVILDKGRAVVHKDIVVNDPLRYKGINIFQSSYGQLRDAPSSSGNAGPLAQEIELHIRSIATGKIYALKARLGQSMELPEDLGSLVINSYQPEAQFRGMNLGPALEAGLTPKGGQTQNILLPLKFPKFDTMRRGAEIISVTNALNAPEPRYYTGLQVTYDPGVGLVYAGFVLIILGCAVAFFMAHQRVVVEVQPAENGSHVMLSGTTNKNKMGYLMKLDRLADNLAALGGRSGTES
jgi:cytochrome c biogenesis protein